MKTTNTLLVIITIILVICVAEHYGTRYFDYLDRQMMAEFEMKQDSIRRIQVDSLMASFEQLDLDSLDKIK